MAQNETRKQEFERYMETVDPNIERYESSVLKAKTRSTARDNRNSTLTGSINVMYYAVGALELLLLVRVILHMIGADPGSMASNFVNNLSYPFIVFFASHVQNPNFGMGGVLEISTIIAMLLLAITTWMLSRLSWLALSRN